MYKAFTFIELIIVTAITVLLLTFAVISFSPDNDLVNKRERFNNFLAHYHYAQDLSLTENKYTYLVINSETRSYELFSSNIGEDRSKETLYIENKEFENIDLSKVFERVSFTGFDESASLEIIFSPWGTNNFNEPIFISFDDLKINIESVTGFVF
tara:strand:- start:1447 stop:1911 length:465 start_codon:yes stop_codon:yes gene_type:complete